MSAAIKRIDIEAAINDLKNRTLAALPCDMSRLVYLASIRDYNTAQYYHAGLAARFTEEVASSALAACHREIFDNVTASSLEELLNQITIFAPSAGTSIDRFVVAWSKLEPYRITIPDEVDSLVAELFFANVKTALAILSGSTVDGSQQCA